MTIVILLLIIATNAIHYFGHPWEKRDIPLLLVLSVASALLIEQLH